MEKKTSTVVNVVKNVYMFTQRETAKASRLSFDSNFLLESSWWCRTQYDCCCLLLNVETNLPGQEDEKMVELVGLFGPKRWSAISQRFPGRIGKQCRER